MRMNFLVYGNPFPDNFLRITDQALEEHQFTKGFTYITEKKEDVAECYRSFSGGKELESDWVMGGSGANVAKVLAMLFDVKNNEKVSVKLVGRVNHGDIGQKMIERIRSLGVEFLHKVSEMATGIACCLVTEDTQRTMKVWLGAAVETGPQDIQEEDMKGTDHLHIEGYFAYYGNEERGFALEKAIDVAKQVNPKMTISIDLAAPNLVQEKLERFLAVVEKVDFIFGNRAEFEALNGGSPINDIFFSEFFDKHVVVMTDGANGCYVKDKGSKRAVHYPALKVDGVVDTTGAGDYFDAGFLYAYFKKMSIAKCVDIANWAATRIIRVLGADLDQKGWQELLDGVKAVEEREEAPGAKPGSPGKALTSNG